MMRTAAAFALVLLSTGLSSAAEMEWRKAIRPALEEAEGRGVPLLVYLTRDE